MTHFKEKQKFTDWGIGAFFILFVLPLLIILILCVVTKDDEMLAALGIVAFTFSLLALIFFLPTLKTEIDDKGVYLSFKPFTNRFITWAEIETAEVIKYGFVGYGWRLSFKYGKVYNVKGNKGLFIQLKNKQKLVIGTQNERELKAALEACQGKLKPSKTF